MVQSGAHQVRCGLFLDSKVTVWLRLARTKTYLIVRKFFALLTVGRTFTVR
jgi:hypothetical protein